MLKRGHTYPCRGARERERNREREGKKHLLGSFRQIVEEKREIERKELLTRVFLTDTVLIYDEEQRCLGLGRQNNICMQMSSAEVWHSACTETGLAICLSSQGR